jgi:hypothetical protein
MRSPAAGLLVALVIVVLALIVAFVGAAGLGLIGLLLSRWFELTQWQGSLIGLGALVSVSLLVFRLLERPAYTEPEWWDFDYPEEDEELEVPAEPPIVPWRRQRPTQGQPPVPRDKKR